jgi:hypothetical protein
MLRDVATAARQWAVAGTAPARDAFAAACTSLADAVDRQIDEERRLLPLLDGLSRATRSAWRRYGGRHYRATVVRLRGAPPAL